MMRVLIMIIVVLTLTSCSKPHSNEWKWDPVNGLIRITFGQVK
jgi:hypothetical protein